MAVPKSRHTSSKKRRRRSHISLGTTAFGVCSKCGKEKQLHRVCPYCGHYKGVMVVDVLKNLEKREKKKREKEIKQKEKEDVKEKGPLNLKRLSRKEQSK